MTISADVGVFTNVDLWVYQNMMGNFVGENTNKGDDKKLRPKMTQWQMT